MQIKKKYLQKQYGNPCLKDVRYIAIDEFWIKKGRKYMTVIYDLVQGRVIYISEGRESETLQKFWKRLKSMGAQVEAIAMDMWPAYIKSVYESDLRVDIVFDKFHIIRKMNEETELNERKLIKGLRWLLLKKGKRRRD